MVLEPESKFYIGGALGVLALIALCIWGAFYNAPTLTITVDYPSIVYKPSEFKIQLSINNIVKESYVENTIKIDSGELIQLDNIPTDCEELKGDERSCDEALTFKVTNDTKSGTTIMKFTVDSEARPNFFILNRFVEVSSASTTLEIPINVETPEVNRLYSQSTLTHNKPSFLKWFGLSFLIALAVAIVVTVLLFVPNLLELIGILGLFS